ncbi:MAG: hypothetical protein M1822_000960 [Bathelium mastoideum]|nr:MAG: hypothetical protein M1822_000960 [Bathelium mastoideum]
MPRNTDRTETPPSITAVTAENGNASQQPPHSTGTAAWWELPEARVKIFNLPRPSFTWHLYKEYKGEGNISRIDISEGDATAVITFEPPSENPFWIDDAPGFAQATGRVGHAYPAQLLPPTQFLERPVHPDESATGTYPPKLSFVADSIKFGVLTAPNQMSVTRTLGVDDMEKGARPVNFTLDMVHREIQIRFSMKSAIHREEDNKRSMGASNFMMRIRLADISRIYKESAAAKEYMTIPLEKPAKFFCQREDWEKTHKGGRCWAEGQMWIRQTEILRGGQNLKNQKLALRQPDQIVDLGRWTVYRLEWSRKRGPMLYEPSSTVLQALSDYKIEVIQDRKINLTSQSLPPLDKWLDGEQEQQKERHSNLALLAGMGNGLSPLDFKIRYQLEVCLSQGIFPEPNITEAFLLCLGQEKPDCTVSILERVANTRKSIFEPMKLFNLPQADRSTLNRTVPPYCSYVRSATITPTTILFNTPVVETSNRVTRHFEQYEDRFLRIRFAEEKNEGRINPPDDDRNEPIFARISRILNSGITFGNRHYEFVAFGNSQFREHGAWFFAGTQDLDASGIREWMGDFKAITNIGKYTSRLGQCFSTTRAMKFTSAIVEPLEDVTRNGFCFTDGVGKISRPLSQRIAAKLNLDSAWTDPPSAFQIRFAGCKGMLVADPSLDHNTIVIRRSQEKFPAEHRGLEIVRVSQYAAATLNRQLIAVLSTLGVPQTVFINKMVKMLNQLESAMTNQAAAIEMLRKNVDINQMSLVLAAMVSDGFMKAKDPFVMSLLQLWKAWSMKYLKEKAKIFVDKGAFVFGVTDESGTLKGHYEGHQCKPHSTREERLKFLPEIFLQISDVSGKGPYKIITGTCILARNPSLHPGDVRVVHAVDVEALHHLKNVVAFPQSGDRDLANMCAGGDLDGDDYIVIWDEELLPSEINHPPMSYSSPPPKKSDSGVTVNDMIKFFIEYMKNDRLGAIATAHLAIFDRSFYGVKDRKCLELADLHSLAVDYPKTGVAAKMSNHLRPSQWPHFMEKNHLPQSRRYVSTSVLGRLYDQVGSFDYEPELELCFDKRVLEACTTNEDMVTIAARIKEDYDTAISQIMSKHGIATEFEVWSTFVLRHNHESKDYTFAEELGKLMTSVKDHFRQIIYKEVGGERSERLAPFAHAMYVLTARQSTSAIEERKQSKLVRLPKVSFPWILQDQLGKLANGREFSKGTTLLGENQLRRELKDFKDLGVAFTDEGGTTKPLDVALADLEARYKALKADQ